MTTTTNPSSNGLQDVEAERALMSAIRMDITVIPEVTTVLMDTDEITTVRYRIFFEEATKQHASSGSDVDSVLLKEAIQRRDVDADALMRELLKVSPSSSNAKHYAERVHEAAQRRDVVRRATDAADAAKAGESLDYIAKLLQSPERSEPIEILPYADLATRKPNRAQAIIDGVLRRGAVGTLIGGTKTRKSWALGLLAAAALSGGRLEWLGYRVEPCRVLVIDGELTPATLYFRYGKIFEAVGLTTEQTRGLDLIPLRGRTKQVSRALDSARAKGPGYYGVIILDPLYTIYPPDPRFNENDNAAMRRLYDEIIMFAGQTMAAVLVCHHLSKGDQSQKNLTDLGAGAGAISRAGDAHLALLPHQEPDVVVLNGVVRDFPELTPSCWRWTFPLFNAAEPELHPEDIQRPARGGSRQKNKTADFLSKAAEMTPEDFVKTYLGQVGKEIEVLEVEGHKKAGLKAAKVRQLAKAAVGMGLAHKWQGGTRKPTRYATIPEPVTASVA